jgi:hypothetical protein
MSEIHESAMEVVPIQRPKSGLAKQFKEYKRDKEESRDTP